MSCGHTILCCPRRRESGVGMPARNIAILVACCRGIGGCAIGFALLLDCIFWVPLPLAMSTAHCCFPILAAGSVPFVACSMSLFLVVVAMTLGLRLVAMHSTDVMLSLALGCLFMLLPHLPPRGAPALAKQVTPGLSSACRGMGIACIMLWGGGSVTPPDKCAGSSQRWISIVSFTILIGQKPQTMLCMYRRL